MHDTARMRQAQPDGTGVHAELMRTDPVYRAMVADDIVRASGCVGRYVESLGYVPAGRPLVPGQDATPREGKDLRFIAMFAIGFTVGIVVGAVGAVL